MNVLALALTAFNLDSAVSEFPELITADRKGYLHVTGVHGIGDA